MKEIEIKTYYTKEHGVVYEHRKIGNGDWEKIETYYGEVPYNYVNFSTRHGRN